jgi:hypothetical protein
VRPPPRRAIRIDVEQIPRWLRQIVEVMLRPTGCRRLRLFTTSNDQTGYLIQSTVAARHPIGEVEHAGLTFPQDNGIGASE